MNTDERVITLVGQPNSGKTTLFNHLTGSRFKTVNYPGSTVDYAIGTAKLSSRRSATVFDTPGIISLFPKTEDEKMTMYALTHVALLSKRQSRYPDLVVSVVDATQPIRHLVLVKQLIDAGFRVLVVLTMTDIAKKRGISFKIETLQQILKCPVVEINGRTGFGLSELRCIVDNTLQVEIPQTTLNLPQALDGQTIRGYFAWAEDLVKQSKTTLPVKNREFDPDVVMLHPILGPILFLGVMTVFFWSMFWLAAPLMDGVDTAFSSLAQWVGHSLPNQWWSHLITDGVITGVGAVAVFIPQIVILFFALGLLESSGYLARGAVLVDRPLSMIGLNGKSFVPLLSGFACAIPAMMAARTIPNRKERLLTILVIPLMSCSARLPVFGLLLSLLFVSHPLWAGIGLTVIYVGSIVIGSVVAAIAGRFFKAETVYSGFQIELPQWRWPILKNVILQTYDQSLSFVRRAGPTIVVVGICLWALTYFPTPEASFAGDIGKWLTPILEPMGVDWRVGVALLLAFAAREVFVSALAVIFAVQNPDSTASMLSVLKHATFEQSSQLIFTPATIVGLVLFFMVSMQCLSTLVVAKKETGNWVMPGIMLGVYMTLAYALAVIAVQGLRLIGIM